MNVSLQDLFDVGCHLGHQAQKWHPKIKPWIYGVQDGIHIFDLEKTMQQLEKAQKRIQELKSEGKSLVVVATKKQAVELVVNIAQKVEIMYIINRWPGGLITNWDQVRKSIKRMNDIENGLASGKFKENTKYERLLMEKELNRLKRLFGGLKNLKNRPDALLVIDGMKEKNAMGEAAKEGVELIALVDSNTDPSEVNIPIPANDDAISSIKIIIEALLLPELKTQIEEKKEKQEVEEKVEKVAVEKNLEKIKKEEPKEEVVDKKIKEKKEKVVKEKTVVVKKEVKEEKKKENNTKIKKVEKKSKEKVAVKVKKESKTVESKKND